MPPGCDSTALPYGWKAAVTMPLLSCSTKIESLCLLLKPKWLKVPLAFKELPCSLLSVKDEVQRSCMTKEKREVFQSSGKMTKLERERSEESAHGRYECHVLTYFTKSSKGLPPGSLLNSKGKPSNINVCLGSNHICECIPNLVQFRKNGKMAEVDTDVIFIPSEGNETHWLSTWSITCDATRWYALQGHWQKYPNSIPRIMQGILFGDSVSMTIYVCWKFFLGDE